jgi:hypothetical protein
MKVLIQIIYCVIHLNALPVASVMFEFASILNLKHKNNGLAEFYIYEE